MIIAKFTYSLTLPTSSEWSVSTGHTTKQGVVLGNRCTRYRPITANGNGFYKGVPFTWVSSLEAKPLKGLQIRNIFPLEYLIFLWI